MLVVQLVVWVVFCVAYYRDWPLRDLLFWGFAGVLVTLSALHH